MIRMDRAKANLLEILAVLSAIAVFSFLFLQTLLSPGVWNDEAAVGMHAWDLLVSGIAVIYPCTAYLMVPLTKFLGPGIVSLRLSAGVLAVLYLIFSYLLLRGTFGRKIALFVLFLQAANPAFVQFTKIASFLKDPFIVFLFWIAVYFMFLFFRQGGRLFLFFGSFILGFLLCLKETSLAYFLAMGVIFILKSKAVMLKVKRRRFSDIFLSVSAFMLGGSCFIVYNFQTGGGFFRRLYTAFLPQKSNVLYIDNSRFFDNLMLRFEHLIGILGFRLMDSPGWGVYFPEKWMMCLCDLLVFVNLLALVVVVWLCFVRKAQYLWLARRMAVISLFFIVIFISTCFSTFHFTDEHLFFLFPLFPLLLAVSAVVPRGSTVSRIVLLSVFFVFPFASGVFMNIHYNLQLRLHAGVSTWSRSTYEVVDYLSRNDIANPVVLFQEPYMSLSLLSAGRVNGVLLGGVEQPLEVFGEAGDIEFFKGSGHVGYLCGLLEKEFLRLSQDGKAVYFLSKRILDPHYAIDQALLKFVPKSGKKLSLEMVFPYNRENICYVLYALK